MGNEGLKKYFAFPPCVYAVLQICLAQEYGASGVVFILNDARPYVFRATGEVPRLL